MIDTTYSIDWEKTGPDTIGDGVGASDASTIREVGEEEGKEEEEGDGEEERDG